MTPLMRNKNTCKDKVREGHTLLLPRVMPVKYSPPFFGNLKGKVGVAFLKVDAKSLLGIHKSRLTM